MENIFYIFKKRYILPIMTYKTSYYLRLKNCSTNNKVDTLSNSYTFDNIQETFKKFIQNILMIFGQYVMYEDQPNDNSEEINGDNLQKYLNISYSDFQRISSNEKNIKEYIDGDLFKNLDSLTVRKENSEITLEDEDYLVVLKITV